MTEQDFKEYIAVSELGFAYQDVNYCAEWDKTEKAYVIYDAYADKDYYFKTLDDMLDKFLIRGKPLKDVLQDIDW